MENLTFLAATDVLFGEKAVLVYAILIIVTVILLVILVMANASKKSIPFEVIQDKAASGKTLTKAQQKKLEKLSRFPELLELDKNRESFQRPAYYEPTLSEFCENFRNFSAYQLKLYYDITDIRRFITGLATSHTMILQGMSGTGKTSLAYAFGEFINNTSSIIPIQPMWKERTDLVGYYNEFTKKFNETDLLKVMYKANYSKDIFITVLDEVNIARVEYYFAEFLSLLEIPNPEGRKLVVTSATLPGDPLQFEAGKITLPNNMWFIGTANNDDSTFAISDKVYDRAMIMNLDYKSKPFSAPKTEIMPISIDHFYQIVDEALKQYEISERNLERIRALDEYMITHFHITFGNRIMKQIQTYVPIFVACGGDEVEAIDDILAKKILRKLESQNPIAIKEASGGFINYLEELFGTGKMPICTEFMHRLEKNA